MNTIFRLAQTMTILGTLALPAAAVPAPEKTEPGVMIVPGIIKSTGTIAAEKAAAAAAKAAKAAKQVADLQDYGVAPVVYIQDPGKLTTDQTYVELYSLYPAKKASANPMEDLLRMFNPVMAIKDDGPENPTKAGKALLELLDRTPTEKVAKITKAKFYMLLAAIADYTKRADDPRYLANPELLDTYKKRIDVVMARETPANDTDLAGLGKGSKSIRATLKERQEVLAKAIALMEKNDKTSPADLEFMKRVEAEMGTLKVDGSGAPLIPSTLQSLVKAIPEGDLTQQQWKTIFESYPMGASLWGSRVDKLWRNKIDGTGMTIAIIDTGIDKDHPFLAGHVQDGIDGSNFTAHRYIDHDHKDADGKDLFGKPNYTGHHGSHVASTVLAYAPGAKIINIKVLDEEVAEQIPPELKHDDMMTIAAIRGGLQNVYEHNKAVAAGTKKGDKIDIISMSLGIPGSNTAVFDPANPDELSLWIKKLSDQGVVVVIAAGNESTKTLRRPAVAQEAITVGAVDYFNRITDFSSDQTVMNPAKRTITEKPDIWAYGSEVNAAKFDPKTKYDDAAPGELSERMSGTSMATPHVAGITILLMQEARRNGVELNGEQVKKILQETSSPMGNGNAFSRSDSGVIDANAAVAYLKKHLAMLRAMVSTDTGKKPAAIGK